MTQPIYFIILMDIVVCNLLIISATSETVPNDHLITVRALENSRNLWKQGNPSENPAGNFLMLSSLHGGENIMCTPGTRTSDLAREDPSVLPLGQVAIMYVYYIVIY